MNASRIAAPLTLLTLLLSGCVKMGFPALMCQYRGNWTAADDFAVDATKDASGYRPVADKLGNVFVVGYALDAADQEHWIVRKSADRGQSWSTVEDFQLASGNSSLGLGIVAQTSGKLIAVGYAMGATALEWLVRVSSDAGTTWTTTEDFQLAANKTATADSVTQDSSGALYVTGTAADSNDVYHWLVRKSSDGGTTWSTIDDYNETAGKDAFAEGNLFDQSGTLYVAGKATTAADLALWTIRKSVNNGATWVTADQYSKAAGQTSVASGLADDNEGAVVAVGYANTEASVPLWTTRRSADGGVTWTTVDEYYLAEGQDSRANSVAHDPFGNLYVVGSAVDALTKRHLILRKSADGGKTWSTLHDYQVSADADTSGYRLSSDPDGNLYVVGRGQASPTASYRWFTHRLNCE